MNMRRTHPALYRPLPEDASGAAGSDTPNGGGGGAPGVTPKPAPAPEPDKTFGQADVDRIVAERVARERAKYADHDDLRKAAKRLEEIEAANATDLEKAVKAAREEGRAEVLSAANQRTLNAEARALAAAAKFRNPVLAVRSIDLSGVKVSDDGSVDSNAINQRTESLVILGGDADVDRFIVQTRGNIQDQRAVQTNMKVRSAAFLYQDTFINGDVTVNPKGFDGLKKRLTGGQVIAAGANGAPVVGNGGTDTHAFFDQLDALASAVGPGGPDAFYCNATIRGRILSAGRRVGGADLVNEDITGKRVVMWNGVPVLDIGSRSDGTAIIPQTETQGTATNASSVYAVRFGQGEGDQAVTGLTNGGVQAYDLGELTDKPAYRTRIEFYCGMGIFGNGAARLTGVLAA
jgi:hypothetical protein